MKEYYKKTIEELYKNLDTNKEGLTKEEVEKRLIENGYNKIEETKKDSKLKKFFLQFNNLMIIILLISSLISFITAYIHKESYTDAIIILAIVFLNALLGYLEESKADKAVESLKNMSTPHIKVKRDGKVEIIETKDLVVGDLILIEAGDYVPADARIIFTASLEIDESPLTGESVPVSKEEKEIMDTKSLSERKNMIYAGCTVTYGRGEAIVTETGMNTELGKIAKSLSKEEKLLTPLQIKIKEISKILSVLVGIIVFVVLVIGIVKGDDLLKVFMLSVSLAVAAIPEGLPAVITVILSLGMGSMAKKNAIIRKMNSVETLGSASIICTDKTGTLTQNKMTIKEIYYNGELHKDNYKEIDEKFIHALALCNDIVKENGNYMGDPTEVAMFKYVETLGYNVTELKEEHKRISEVPFDSERKMMSTIHKKDKEAYVYTKGSLDSLIERCTKYYKDGKELKLTDKLKEEIKNIGISQSNKAYRVLSFAYKKAKNEKINNVENDLVFVGLVCMIDPPRKGVKESIKECFKAGIMPVMITGDSLNTAIAIGKDIGLLEDEKEAITGDFIDTIDDIELMKRVHDFKVYARVSPEHKLRIVKAWQANNKVVAMTGDGVNDAPAIKLAHVGIGMGITGTEVTKSVSDVVLADDHFSTIVVAIKEGRKIYDNIRNVILYLLTGNFVEIVIVFVSMLFGLNIFLPIHLLFINLITDSIPAICLAFENEAEDLMSRGVRDMSRPFFTHFLIARITITSILKIIYIFFVYLYGMHYYGVNVAITMAFIGLILIEMLLAFSSKDPKKNVLRKGLFDNKYLNISILGLIVVQAILFTTKIKDIFRIVILDFKPFMLLVSAALVIFAINELTKKIVTKKFED
jgi:ATPase, P-type (transporting), HAD superfamily, subfamily IC